MRPLNSILLTMGAVAAVDTQATTVTFDPDMGINGTLTIDPSVFDNAEAKLLTYTFVEGSGVNGTVEIDTAIMNNKVKELAAHAAADDIKKPGGPKKKDCDKCYGTCIPMCTFPPLCVV